MARPRSDEFCSPPKAPVFEPTVEEFKDPLGYINKIRPAAERVGICKIRPPPDWTPSFAVDLEAFKFVPRVQRLNELEAHCRVKMNFMAGLAKFWELQGSTLKRPQIEGYPLDLHELWKVVMEEGGYEHVMVAKRWSLIARKMGYKKLQHSSFSLRQHYEKILYPYCVFRAVEMSEIKEACPKQTKGFATSAMSTHSMASSQREMKKSLRSAEGASEHVSLDDKNNVTKATAATRSYVDKPAVCKVCDKRSEKERLLVCDNCLTCIHTFCLITPLPSMPTGGWQCPSCIAAECSKKQESYGFEESKQVYNLESFGEMANRYKCEYFQVSSKPQSVAPELVEKEFWRLVESSEDQVVVQYGADLHSSKHGSGFPFGNRVFTEEDVTYAESPWNLNNLPNLESSVLRHVMTDISGMKVPWLYVGMCFSSFCWHNEDHWSYSINYLHWGEPKTWYGVPGHCAEKFEKVMESAVPELFRDHPDLLHHLVTLLSPALLMSKKVPVVSTNQCAGEFVVTFPRAYHAGFNQGFNLAEAVNFCPADWIPNGRACVDHYREMRRYTVFSHDELICRMALNVSNLDLHIAEAVNNDLAVLLEHESALRDTVAKAGITQEECESFELLPDDERQCSYCNALCFLSGVSCSCKSGCMVCLHHISELCSCPASEKTLRYRYTLPAIRAMKSRVTARAQQYVTWTKEVERLLDAEGDDRATLSDLQLLASEAENSGFSATDLTEELQMAISETAECAVDARELIEKKLGCKTDQAATLEELKRFMLRVRKLPGRIDEGDQIQNLLYQVEAFHVAVEAIMDDSCPPVDKLSKLLEEGKSIDIVLPQLPALELKLRQAKWMEAAKDLLVVRKDRVGVSLDVVEDLIVDGQQYLPNPDVDKAIYGLTDIVSLSKHWEQLAGVLVEEKPTVSHAQSVLSESASLPVKVHTLDALKAAVVEAVKWSEEAGAIQDSDISPELDMLEMLLNRSRSIPLQLEQLAQIESLVAAAQGWRDRASRSFLKKGASSSCTLLQVLYPRLDTRQRLNLDSKPAPPHFTAGGSSMDAGEEVALLTQLAREEVDEIRQLRAGHIAAMSADERSLANDEAPTERHCVCHKPMSGVMLMCELCLEWFHTSCVYLPRTKPPAGSLIVGKEDRATSQAGSQLSTAALKENKFLCMTCVRSRRPRLDVVLSLLVSLRKVPVQLMEGPALQSLTERAMQWQERCRKSLAEVATMLAPQNSSAASAILSSLQPSPDATSGVLGTTNSGSTAPSFISRSQPLPLGLVAAATQAAPCKSQLRSTAPLGRPSGSSSQNQSTPVVKSPAVSLPVVRSVSVVEVSSQQGISALSLPASDVTRRCSPVPAAGGFELPASVRGHLEELMMQGDLLEVTLDETQQLWQLLHLCTQTAESVIIANLSVQGDQAKDDRKRRRKRKHDGEIESNNGLVLKDELSPAVALSDVSDLVSENDAGVLACAAAHNTSGEPDKKRCLVRRSTPPLASSGISTSGPASAAVASTCHASTCQAPAGDAAGWAQCEACADWFHIACVGLCADSADTVEAFTCSRCCPSAGGTLANAAFAFSNPIAIL